MAYSLENLFGLLQGFYPSLYIDVMAYHYSSSHWALPRKRLPSYSHEAPRVGTADQPMREEQNEQNEHGREASTNDERERTGPHFP